MTGPQELQIIRAMCPTTAPTSDGLQYECEDGSTWRDAEPFESVSRTGLALGQRVGDKIYPRSGGR